MLVRFKKHKILLFLIKYNKNITHNWYETNKLTTFG